MKHGILSLLILATLGATGAWCLRPAANVASVVTQPVQGKSELPDRKLLYQGTASCAAGTCHHLNGPAGEKRSEYTTWMTHDRHARAYARLFEDSSQKMVRAYRESAGARAEVDPLCLSCHVLPDYEALRRDGRLHDRFSALDGVGCEACHGPAERWRDKHYRDDWKKRKPAEKVREGMRDTKDLRTRAEGCVQCHVGNGKADVNHDLIAAGHPRLRFEYSAYLANLPRHWKPDADKERHSDFEARVWLLGQLVSAKAALKLLEERSKGDEQPWPEFAEYACADCHHRLKQPSHRQSLDQLAGRRAGEPRWGSWYHRLLPALARNPATGANPAVLLPVLRLQQEVMPNRRASRGSARKEAEKASAALDGWLNAGISRPLTAKDLLKLLLELVKAAQPNADWETGTQIYLAAFAIQQGLKDLEPALDGDAKLEETVRSLGVLLEDAFHREHRTRFDTPSEFEPKQLQRELLWLEKEVRGIAEAVK